MLDVVSRTGGLLESLSMMIPMLLFHQIKKTVQKSILFLFFDVFAV